MQLSSTLSLLLACATLLTSTPSVGAAMTKLRGRQRNLEGTTGNAGGQEAQQRRKLKLSHGTLCNISEGDKCSKNCEGGCFEYWYSKAWYACGFEPDWEDGTRCAAGTTCNACKDGYYEYWDSLAFTACGREPCWEDGAYCAAGTTCNECCNSYHYNTKWAWTLCGESY